MKLYKDILNIIYDYKKNIEEYQKTEKIKILVKMDKVLEDIKSCRFCDICDKTNCVIKYRNCSKLEEPVESMWRIGIIITHAYNVGFCNKCIKTIKNFDRYSPRNT